MRGLAPSELYYRWLELFEIERNVAVHLNTPMTAAATLLNPSLIHVNADSMPSLGNSFRRKRDSQVHLKHFVICTINFYSDFCLHYITNLQVYFTSCNI
jgi:hypothetical protein